LNEKKSVNGLKIIFFQVIVKTILTMENLVIPKSLNIASNWLIISSKIPKIFSPQQLMKLNKFASRKFPMKTIHSLNCQMKDFRRKIFDFIPRENYFVES